MDWYIAQNGQPQKISIQNLIEKIQNHELPDSTWVFNDELKDWTPLSETELWKTFSSPATSFENRIPPIPAETSPNIPHKKAKIKPTPRKGLILSISVAIISLSALIVFLTQGGLEIQGTTVVGYRGWSKLFTETLQIPAGITRIENQAFEGCTKLTSVLLPSELIEIGDRAFSNCTNLVDINIPNRVSYIGNAAFQGCSSLPKIKIIQGTLGRAAFKDCTSLTYADIGSSVEFIPENAFENCTNLTEVSLEPGISEIGYSAFKGCTLLSKINVPNGLIIIGSEAFSDCTSLTSFRFPLHMRRIGSGAFSNCTSLSDVYFEDPNGLFHFLDQLAAPPKDYRDEYLYEIEPDTFCGCTSLTSFIIPINAETICAGAFRGCTNLESVILFNEDTIIAPDAFQDCPNLICLSYYQYSDGEYDYFLEKPLNATEYSVPAGPITTDDKYIQTYYTGNQQPNLDIVARYEDPELQIGLDVTFSPTAPVSNFCIVSFAWLEDSPEDDDISFVIDQISLYVGDLYPGQAVEALLYIGEYFPCMGYAYTDSDGVDHVFYVGEGGGEGGPFASSYTIEQKIPPLTF